MFFAAFRLFGTDSVLGLFLCFAAGLVAGVAVPVVYTVWRRQRPLASLGLGLHDLPLTIALGLLFAAIQFALTLWGYDLPASGEDWVPLLVMALVVGIFESIFFRGFVQGRLVAMFGSGVGVAAAAGLYGLYHVGYGMGLDEMVFLLGLGVVYAIAYQLTDNLLVLWPLLTPLGSFYAKSTPATSTSLGVHPRLPRRRRRHDHRHRHRPPPRTASPRRRGRHRPRDTGPERQRPSATHTRWRRQTAKVTQRGSGRQPGSDRPTSGRRRGH